MRIRKFLKSIPFVGRLVLLWRTVRSRPSLPKRIRLMKGFYADLDSYAKQRPNEAARLDKEIFKPMILDKTASTGVDPVYFYQDAWCAGKVFKAKPTEHFDIGSKAEMVAIISQFVPTTMVDIRPIDLELPGLFFKKGSILALPFKDGSVASLSSICVIEHIGLGRYGDEIDSFGTEKAAKELCRVLAKGGNLYVSVPVDKKDCVYFNAHRAFTRDYVLRMFKDLDLKEEKYVYGRSLTNHYDSSLGFGTGLFHFVKNK